MEMDWIQRLYIIGVVTLGSAILFIAVYLLIVWLKSPVRDESYEADAEVARKENGKIYLSFEEEEYPFQNERMMTGLFPGDQVGILVHDVWDRMGRRISRELEINDLEFK